MTSALQKPAQSPSEQCAHCGAELGSPFVDEAGLRFCCAGCRTVHTAIHAAGLEAFYADREISAVRPRPARPSGRRFAEFDDPTLAARDFYGVFFTSVFSVILFSTLATPGTAFATCSARAFSSAVLTHPLS